LSRAAGWRGNPSFPNEIDSRAGIRLTLAAPIGYLAATIETKGVQPMTIYLKRRGVMMFWRIGRIGGSFYLARNVVQQT
jgi:hypothetical protein